MNDNKAQAQELRRLAAIVENLPSGSVSFSLMLVDVKSDDLESVKDSIGGEFIPREDDKHQWLSQDLVWISTVSIFPLQQRKRIV